MLFLAIGGLLQKNLADDLVENSPAPELVSTLAEDIIEPEILQRTQQVMAQEQLFLKSELSLKEFATTLKMPAREVSNHINTGLGLTFIDFVNGFHVVEVKRWMASGEAKDLSLFGMTMDFGFNSKSTFNRAFRKITEKTPSDYQNTVQNQS